MISIISNPNDLITLGFYKYIAAYEASHMLHLILP